MGLGRKFRISLSKKEKTLLARWIGAQAFIWNAKFNERRMWRSLSKLDARQYPDHRDWPEQDAAYSWIGESPETAWLGEIPSQIKRNAAAEFATAVTRKLRGLAGEPHPKTPSSKKSVWITRELFEFVQGPQGGVYIAIGTKAKPLCRIKVNASRSFDVPASIRISVDGNAWFVSFASGSAAEEKYPETQEEIAARLAMMGAAEISEKSWGADRGVNIPLAGSDGTRVMFKPVQEARMAEKEKKAAKWERKLARQKKQYAKQKEEAAKAGKALPKISGKQRKTIAKIRKQKGYAAHVRDDVAHKATTRLANGPCVAFAMEDLKIKKMTKAPKPKPDPTQPGSYLKNGRKAKAGLNKAILASMWGRFARLLEYKAKEKGKLFLRVDPKHTSQECSDCGCIHPGNRLNQALFACTACGHKENADHNAAKVIKARMVALVLAGKVGSAPKVKKVSARKGKSLAAGCRVGRMPQTEEEQGDVLAMPSIQASMKRESSSFMAR